MKTFDGIAAAADAVRRFFFRNEDALPAKVREKVEPHVGTGSSPVDLIVNFAEGVYANRGEGTPAEALEIAAGCAAIIDQDGYHGRLDNRAAGISLALRRDSGERAATGASWPKKSDDPDAKADFTAPAEAPAAEAPQEPAK